MKYVAPILAGLTLTIGGGALVASAQTYAPLAPLPGTYTSSASAATTDLSTYLSGAIKLLIAVSGAIAVLMLIIAGAKYVAAGINPSAKSDAKGDITNALIGLVLVLTSYLILNTIDPKLVHFNLTLPPVGGIPTSPSAVTASPTPAASGVCPSPNDTSAGCCPGGSIPCTSCSGCTLITTVAHKTCGVSNCYLNTILLSKIQAINISGWRITESWPPTVKHASFCHQNGTCADLNNTGGATDTTTIKSYYLAFKAAGLNVLYESNNCGPYIAAGVTNCKTYSTMTNGSSFHVTP